MARKITKRREVNNKILIVCGGKTERLYLNKFNLELAQISIYAKLDNRNPKAIVQTAIEMKSKNNYKQVWCIFDRDNFTCFDEAIELGKKNDIRCVYSNQAYELWYVLHFERKEGSMDRKKYAEYISKKIGRKYSKTDENMYQTLKSKTNIAIQNAKIGHQLKRKDGGKPSSWESCTNMYELVEELIKWK